MDLPEPTNPDAFQVTQDADGRWATTDVNGDVDNRFDTEEYARRYVNERKYYWQWIQTRPPRPTSSYGANFRPGGVPQPLPTPAAPPAPAPPPAAPAAPQPQPVAQSVPQPVPQPTPSPLPAPLPAAFTPIAPQFAPSARPTPRPSPFPTRWQVARHHFTSAIPHAAAFGGARGVARAAGATFGAAFPEAAVPLAVANQLARALPDAVKNLHDFAEGLVSTNRHLGNYSGLIANEYMRLSLGDYRRNIETAGAAGGSTVNLVHAVDEMRDALQPFRIATTNLQNQAGGFGAGLTKGLADNFVEVANALNKLSDDLTNAEEWGKSVADMIAGAIWGSPIGVTLQGIEWAIGKWWPEFAKQLAALRQQAEKKDPQAGPWDAFIKQEAGPGRMRPLNPPRGGPIQK